MTATLEDSLVNYHGSQTGRHGEWQIARVCICQRCIARVLSGKPARWELVDTRGRDRIKCVRRESFTPYDEMPQAEPEPEHKTRTSQPSGYVEHSPGIRAFGRRGLMHDRFSYWFCTCGAKGGGADRAEARAAARRHREEEAAKREAAWQATIAELRATWLARGGFDSSTI